jgi:ferredoxin-NADP reductase
VTVVDSGFEVVVRERLSPAAGVAELVLAAVDGGQLPGWAPGAHIDVQAGELVRQYSLTGAVGAAEYRIAVLDEPAGRGGSAWLHTHAVPGARLTIGAPRNHFPLDPSPRYLFLAGGIGITPLQPMIAAADAAGADWQLHYAGRNRVGMAFAAELAERYGPRVRLYPGDEDLRIVVPALLAECDPTRPGDGLLVYGCGPRRLLAEVETVGEDWPAGIVRGEHFVPREVGPPVWAGDFEVDLLLSGMTLTVPPDRSILSVVEEAGVTVLSSCQEGTCGTCETEVIEGEIDHRDSVLTPQEQRDGDVMMICVSRAACPRLMLEL